MTRILVFGLLFTVIVTSYTNTSGQTNRKRHRAGRTVTVVVHSWEPEKGSLFHKLTRALPAVSKVEISQIESALAPGPQPDDVVLFENKEPIRVLTTRTLLDRDARSLTTTWRQLNRGSSSACFAPAYLLKFYSAERQLFATIVCFACSNLMLTGGESFGFDADGPAGAELLKKLKALLPQSPNKAS
ncbi:MAG TPA: hypothetical protein VJU84_01510 [Pyrinomonadaceae bacterium]|nr:hypothetical protein [Pyrinomonadaceae bacterium]